MEFIMIRAVRLAVIALILAASPAVAQYQSRPSPYKPLFYDNDFRYLNDAANTQLDCFDVLKQIPVSCLTVDFGGEFRWQGKVENNRRLDGQNNTYNLFRERVYDCGQPLRLGHSFGLMAISPRSVTPSAFTSMTRPLASGK